MECREVIEGGEIIAEYADDRPHPSFLFLGLREERAIHVLAGKDAESGRCHVITVYEPAPGLWGEDYKTRRHP